MHIAKFEKVTLVTADRDKFLKLKNIEESEKLLGKPVRIIFDNSSEIPELEEASLIEE